MYDSVPSDSPAIERIWIGDSFVEPGIGHRSDPVLGADLVFTIVNDTCEIRLQGPVTERTVYTHIPGAEYIGVRFRPGVQLHSGRSALADLTNQASPTLRAGGADLRPLSERLLEVCRLGARGQLVNSFVHQTALAHQGRSPLVAAALKRFSRDPSTAQVQRVAEDLGVSSRSLQRQFKRHLGLSPKHAARLVRVNELLRAINTGSFDQLDLSALAVQAGYFDQSHMTNEVAEILRTTPRILVEEQLAGLGADQR